jgi:hypothetical protein
MISLKFIYQHIRLFSNIRCEHLRFFLDFLAPLYQVFLNETIINSLNNQKLHSPHPHPKQLYWLSSIFTSPIHSSVHLPPQKWYVLTKISIYKAFFCCLFLDFQIIGQSNFPQSKVPFYEVFHLHRITSLYNLQSPGGGSLWTSSGDIL